MHIRYVVPGRNRCQWEDAGWKLVRVGRGGLKISGSGLKMSESRWGWVRMDGSGWESVGGDGSGWEWAGVDGCGWKHGLVQPFYAYYSSLIISKDPAILKWYSFWRFYEIS